MTKIGSHRVSVLSQPLGVATAFAPTDVTGLMLWLDANEGVSVSGSNVTNWADQSGNGNDAAQPTGANRPSYSATSSIRNLPGITFNTGGPEWMSITGSTDFDCASGVDIFIVCHYPTAGDSGVLFRNRPLGGLGTQNGFSIEHSGSDTWDNTLCEMSTAYIIDGTPSVTHQENRSFLQNFRWDFSGSTIEVYENGLDQGIGVTVSGTVANMSQTGDVYIGIAPDESTRPSNVVISEILFYNSYLSDANRSAVTDYLIDKWNLSLSSPSVLSPASWFDASDETTITASAGAVTLFEDKGSLGADVSAAGSARPTTGTATQNGLNLIRFDGSANVMETSSFSTLSDLSYSWFGIFVATNLNVTASTQPAIFSTADSATNGTFEVAPNYTASPDQMRNYWSPGTPSIVMGSVSATGYIVGFTYDETTDSMLSYYKGEHINTDAIAGMTDGVKLVKYKIGVDRGGAEFYEFDLAEIFTKHEVMTADEISQLSTYWQIKWGIT